MTENTTESLLTAATDTTESTVTSEADSNQEQATATEETAPAETKAEDEVKAKEAETETKAEDGDTAADDKPVEYTFELPDGVEMAPETLEGLKGIAGELKLDQDGGQKLASFGAEMFQKWETAQAEGIETVKSEWAEATKADKEIGGANFDKNLGVAKSALEKFGTPELKSFLDETGLGYHPEINRLFWKMGNQISDDTLVAGDPAPTARLTRAERLYGTN